MALLTYANLKTAITSWLDVPTATFTSQIDDLVTVGETRIYRECRTRELEQSMTTSIGSGTVTLPSTYLDAKFFYADTNPVVKLERRPVEWIYERYPSRSSGGIPRFFAREASTFIFGPYPDSGYTIKGVYYRTLGALASSAHALFLANPDLYLFAALAESEPLIGRDQRIAIWEAKYKKILDDTNGAARREEGSGGSLQIR